MAEHMLKAVPQIEPCENPRRPQPRLEGCFTDAKLSSIGSERELAAASDGSRSAACRSARGECRPIESART
eukprot:scaffold246132_cov31-Tisochrysis_lutea.AAC.3